jgi:hypothetical protein
MSGLNTMKDAYFGGSVSLTAISIVSSNTNDNLTINAKGSGTLSLNGTATGDILLTTNVARISVSGSYTIFSAGPSKNMQISGAITSILGTTSVTINQNTAVPAGGSTVAGIQISSTASLGLFVGSGAPTMSAAQGSLYLRTDGSSTSTRLYVNTNGTTGWTNITTAT